MARYFDVSLDKNEFYVTVSVLFIVVVVLVYYLFLRG